MIDGKGGSSADVFFYEAQISLLLVGVDEWLWTVYCCVDTFFGSERAPSNYEHNGQDAPSGGGRQTSYPVWSPRGYFLFVLSRRINQIAKEWRNIVSFVETELINQEHLSGMGVVDQPPFDDRHLTRTKGYRLGVSLLRRFHGQLYKTIQSWEAFAVDELQNFHVESEVLNSLWGDHAASIFSDISELRDMQITVEQWIQSIDREKDDLVNASALRESQNATTQSQYIRLLTIITVIYLPVSLATSIFSMSMIHENMPWYYWVVAVLTLCTLTFSVAFSSLLASAWRWVLRSR